MCSNVPNLTCDRKKVLEIKKLDDKIPSLRKPGDLPGEGKSHLKFNSYYPYDDDSNEQESSSIFAFDIENMKQHMDGLDSDDDDVSDKNFRYNSSTKTVFQKSHNYEESFYVDKRLKPLRTFTLLGKETPVYLCQIVSYYGDTFFIIYDDREVKIGDEFVSLHLKRNVSREESEKVFPETLLHTSSEDYSDSVILFKNGLCFKNNFYVSSNLLDVNKLDVSVYSSYPAFSEEEKEDLQNLCVKVRSESDRLDRVYRDVMANYYNSTQDMLKDMPKLIEFHDRAFDKADKNLIKKAQDYYTSFDANIKKNKPVPSKEDVENISFVSETMQRYTTSYFMLCKTMSESMAQSQKIFDENIQHLYLQMMKDFSDFKHLPIDKTIDIERSYPGKIFRKQT